MISFLGCPRVQSSYPYLAIWGVGEGPTLSHIGVREPSEIPMTESAPFSQIQDPISRAGAIASSRAAIRLTSRRVPQSASRGTPPYGPPPTGQYGAPPPDYKAGPSRTLTQITKVDGVLPRRMNR
jgi:hypothetical protein